MSERKVLNKYFPPDFDPSLIPRRKQPKNSQQVVRLMAPFSMRCNTCGEYIYKGKKFNARKETVEGEDYYGIKIFRFYIKCTLCSAEITFKTDPKNTDYAAEHGASRNFEPWRDEKEVEEEDRLARLEEEENNPMKALENRTQDSKREMDILDALQDIRARNARNERVAAGGSTDLVDKLARQEEEDEEQREKRLADEEDERLVQEVFSKVRAGGVGSSSSVPLEDGTSSDEKDAEESAPTLTIKRKAEGEAPDLHQLLAEKEEKSAPVNKPAVPAVPSFKKQKMDLTKSLGIKIKKGKGKAIPVK
ncbi:DUF572-domain-containing protein [Schizopora paradoxa]|uniref:Splicing factor YJU2 n=1 Tax=Schizopora paradoxa TaxID=27342 RepID=A0A0H2S4R5_9AGAM|nr:DUF572-domain-containing protein [Schizopora paradoxa]